MQHSQPWFTPGQPHPDSPGEQAVWPHLSALGFVANQSIGIADPESGSSIHPDFFHRTGKIVIEIDGQQHNTNPDQVRKDRGRRMAMVTEGWSVMEFEHGFALAAPQVVAKRAQEALASREPRPTLAASIDRDALLDQIVTLEATIEEMEGRAPRKKCDWCGDEVAEWQFDGTTGEVMCEKCCGGSRFTQDGDMVGAYRECWICGMTEDAEWIGHCETYEWYSVTRTLWATADDLDSEIKVSYLRSLMAGSPSPKRFYDEDVYEWYCGGEGDGPCDWSRD